MDNTDQTQDTENGTENGAENGEGANVENRQDENASASEAAQMTFAEVAEPVMQTYDGFDPEIHAMNPDGTPRRKTDGSFALKRGRKPGAKNGEKTIQKSGGENLSVPQDPGPTKSSKAARQANLVTNKQAARMAVRTGVGVLCQVFGDEWQCESQDEADSLVQSVEEYLNAKGQVQMTPETALVLSLSSYFIPRVQHENTKTKLAKAWDWFMKTVLRK